MSIKTWAAEIVLECKRILGIDHAATEQEVHEGLRALKGREEIEAAIRSEVTDQVSSLETTVTEQSAEILALQNQLSELQADLSALTETLETRNTELSAANEQIATLKETLVDDHSGGDTGGGGKSKTPIWDKFKKAHGI